MAFLYDAIINQRFSPGDASLAKQRGHSQRNKEKLLHDDTLVFSLRKVTINAPPDSGALGHCLVESLLQIFFYLLTLFIRQHLINAEVILHAVITRLLIQLRKSG